MLIFSILIKDAWACVAKEKQTCPPQSLRQTWKKGIPVFYFSGYAWHNRYTYSALKIKSYNELAWGGGWGKAWKDEKRNWWGVYALAFLDSHREVEPVIGYMRLKGLPIESDFRFELGYSILLTARADIWNYHPFPGIIPILSLGYKSSSIMMTYIPGRRGVGNVLFITAKWELGS